MFNVHDFENDRNNVLPAVKHTFFRLLYYYYSHIIFPRGLRSCNVSSLNVIFIVEEFNSLKNTLKKL